MRLLQHLAQFAGANLRVQRLLFFVVVQVVLVGLVVVMMRSVELLAFDHLFFHQAAAGRKRSRPPETAAAWALRVAGG